MIKYGIARNAKDLEEIYLLQKRNLPDAISESELRSEGFVTVDHSLDLLSQMNVKAPHIIAFDNDIVIGYALSMMRSFRDSIPILIPMFDEIDQINYEGKTLGTTDYIVMGQICIDKPYRGKGIFQGLYHEMTRRLKSQFDYIITEISLRNPRSVRAHEKAGFAVIHTYRSDSGEQWVIVILSI
jgi:GNAT superfamily N-acetyltransferase